jgi:SPP1 family predicted phage head-tail adaptor
MTCTSTIKFPKPKICTKDLKHRILIQYRETTATNDSDLEPEPTYTDIGNYWAAVKTTPSRQAFNDVNQNGAITTDFYIRFTDTIDFLKNLWIEFKGRRFEVINSDDIDEFGEFFRLRALDKGKKEFNATRT